MDYSILDLESKNYDCILVIGDVHGLYTDLTRLVSFVKEQCSDDQRLGVLLLGDFIDRGPSSALVIDWLLTSEQGVEKLAILGNHEEMMLDFLKRPNIKHPWLLNGGTGTLKSYGLNVDRIKERFWRRWSNLISYIPADHINFLKHLPSVAHHKNMLFAHAGYDYDSDIKNQEKHRLLWGPLPKLATDKEMVGNPMLIHGHTPSSAPEESPQMINLDGGAVYGKEMRGLVIQENNLRAIVTLKRQGTTSTPEFSIATL